MWYYNINIWRIGLCIWLVYCREHGGHANFWGKRDGYCPATKYVNRSWKSVRLLLRHCNSECKLPRWRPCGNFLLKFLVWYTESEYSNIQRWQQVDWTYPIWLVSLSTHQEPKFWNLEFGTEINHRHHTQTHTHTHTHTHTRVCMCVYTNFNQRLHTWWRFEVRQI